MTIFREREGGGSPGIKGNFTICRDLRIAFKASKSIKDMK
jgi:hypothetical protein